MDRIAFLESLPFLVPVSSARGARLGRDGAVGATTTTTATSAAPRTNAAASRRRIPSWPVPKPPACHPAPSHRPPTEESHRGIQYQLKDEVMISKLCLSIEPLLLVEPRIRDADSSSTSDEHSPPVEMGEWVNMGVAFFDADRSFNGSNHQREPNNLLSDPALAACDVELCTYECRMPASMMAAASSPQKGGTTFGRRPNSSRLSSPSGRPTHSSSAAGASIRRSHVPSDLSSSLIASLCMKINDAVFFVNWTRLIGVRVDEPNTGEQHDDDESNPPPCLLLYFPGCLFRLFFSRGGMEDGPEREASDQSSGSPSLLSSSSDRLRALKEGLDQLLLFKSRDAPNFLPQEAHPIAVPRLSVSLLFDESMEESSLSGNSVVEGSEVEKRKQAAEDGATAAIRHRQRAHQQCLDEIASLSTLLQLSASSTAARQMLANRTDTAASIGSLLTTVAQDLATSFPMESIAAAGFGRNETSEPETHRRECLEQRLQQTQKQIDDVLDEYFPAPRLRPAMQRPPTKRPRREEEADPTPIGLKGAVDSAARSNGADPNSDHKPKSSEASPTRVKLRLHELLHQHKLLCREKHDLLGLPTR